MGDSNHSKFIGLSQQVLDRGDLPCGGTLRHVWVNNLTVTRSNSLWTLSRLEALHVTHDLLDDCSWTLHEGAWDLSALTNLRSLVLKRAHTFNGAEEPLRNLGCLVKLQRLKLHSLLTEPVARLLGIESLTALTTLVIKGMLSWTA